MELFPKTKYKYPILYFIEYYLKLLNRKVRFDWMSDSLYITRLFKIKQGFELNLKKPKTLNEKIQWLKLNDRKPFHTICADKLLVRNYLKEKFGETMIIPLLFSTNNYKDINPETLPNEAFILKTNHDAGHFVIVRDKSKIDWKKVKLDFKYWIKGNYYWVEREWQYKNIKPMIIAEKLLVCKNGLIPNDFKVHCINGKVEFIYVALSREGENKRNIYDRYWNPLYFTWAPKSKKTENLRGKEINPPTTLDKMIFYAEEIAKDFPQYVRVDFFDKDGELFFGEITQHHGGGFDQIKPFEFDIKYGELIKI